MTERVTPEELRRVAEDWDVGYDRSEPEGYLVVVLRAAADTIEELTHDRFDGVAPFERGLISAVRDAVKDEGPHPEHHRKVMARHRAEWPTLWAAIDWMIQ